MQQTIAKPIFLVGAERSGTTLLRLMLNYHPKITWCNEFEYAVDMVGEDWPDLQAYYSWLETHRIFQDSHFNIDKTLSYPQLVDSFLGQRLKRDSKPIVGATIHRNFEKTIKIWPDARFIHIVRDGRDVARSCIGMGWAGNVWYGVNEWIKVENLWKEFSKQIPEDRKIEIIYEDLILNYVDTLKNICDFIGVDYDSSMLDYVNSSDYSLPKSHLVQQWKKKQSKREIQLLEYRIADMLVERGYDLSEFDTIEVSPLDELVLKIQNWWGKLLFRRDRIGTSLLISDFLARKMGVAAWQKRTLLQINDIQRRHLKKST